MRLVCSFPLLLNIPSIDGLYTGIFHIFQHVQPGFNQPRICIKIPSTWEGLMACRALQDIGLNTLATTVFTMTQAILAAEVRCAYIAPYVNELKVHFDAGYVSTNILFSKTLIIPKLGSRTRQSCSPCVPLSRSTIRQSTRQLKFFLRA